MNKNDNHLTPQQIIEFVMVDRHNENAMEIIGAVNSHIAGCNECLQAVRAYALIYETLTSSSLNLSDADERKKMLLNELERRNELKLRDIENE